jgi:2-iminobutanoate/2-iminopropanoate deaminase
MKKVINSQEAPVAAGPYSPALEIGEWVFCSGQIGLDPASGKLVEGGIEPQTRRVLQNLRAVLHAAGLGLEDVVKTTIFLADIADWATVNRIYGQEMVSPYPARSTVQVAALPLGARIEIEAIAHRRT